jgi:hypothetical protein
LARQKPRYGVPISIYAILLYAVGREAKTQAFLATRWLRFGDREIEVWRKGSVLHLVWASASIMTGSTPAAAQVPWIRASSNSPK